MASNIFYRGVLASFLLTFSGTSASYGKVAHFQPDLKKGRARQKFFQRQAEPKRRPSNPKGARKLTLITWQEPANGQGDVLLQSQGSGQAQKGHNSLQLSKLELGLLGELLGRPQSPIKGIALSQKNLFDALSINEDSSTANLFLKKVQLTLKKISDPSTSSKAKASYIRILNKFLATRIQATQQPKKKTGSEKKASSRARLAEIKSSQMAALIEKILTKSPTIRGWITSKAAAPSVSIPLPQASTPSQTVNIQNVTEGERLLRSPLQIQSQLAQPEENNQQPRPEVQPEENNQQPQPEVQPEENNQQPQPEVQAEENNQQPQPEVQPEENNQQPQPEVQAEENNQQPQPEVQPEENNQQPQPEVQAEENNQQPQPEVQAEENNQQPQPEVQPEENNQQPQPEVQTEENNQQPQPEVQPEENNQQPQPAPRARGNSQKHGKTSRRGKKDK